MYPKAISCIMLFLIATLVSCKTDDGAPVQSATLIFNSGFEDMSMGFPSEAYQDLQGQDGSVPAPNDWSLFDEHPNIGDFTFQYEGGSSAERFVQIVEDPTDTDNQVLQFWLKTPNVIKDGQRIKGRVQANIYNNSGLTEIYQTGRFYLHPDLAVLNQAPDAFTWLTIFEFWNNPNWQDPDLGFRITIDIQKLEQGPGVPLTFGIHGQELINDRFTDFWKAENRSYEIPVGEWLDYQVYFKEGNGSTGRFYFAISHNDRLSEIFDITNFTHHPEDPSPDGLSHYNPMKLYTSNGLIDYVRENGGVLQIFWDDFALWKNRKPED